MAIFQDFPVLENGKTKFQDFPGFPGPVRTLVEARSFCFKVRTCRVRAFTLFTVFPWRVIIIELMQQRFTEVSVRSSWQNNMPGQQITQRMQQNPYHPGLDLGGGQLAKYHWIVSFGCSRFDDLQWISEVFLCPLAQILIL